MPGHEALSILNIHRLPRFEIKHNPMLRAVIFENPMNVFHPRKQVQKSKKNGDAKCPIDHVNCEPAADRRDGSDGQSGQVKLNKFIKTDEESEREQDV